MLPELHDGIDTMLRIHLAVIILRQQEYIEPSQAAENFCKICLEEGRSQLQVRTFSLCTVAGLPQKYLSHDNS